MSTTHIYFDLLGMVKKINEPFVAAQVMQSVAWRMDTLITSKTRAILRTLREEAVIAGRADSYNETAAMLRDANTAEEWFKATGLDRGLIEEITRLTALREVTHESAAELTALNWDWQGRPRQYEIPDLEEVFHAQPNTRISSQVKSRIEMSSKALAEAYGLDTAVLRERRLATQKRQAEDRAEAIIETADLAWWCYRACLSSQPTELEGLKRDVVVVTQQLALEQGFAGLSIETQLALITGARQAAERAITFAESQRSMADTEFARILACALKTVKDLESAMSAPKFKAASTV